MPGRGSLPGCLRFPVYFDLILRKRAAWKNYTERTRKIRILVRMLKTVLLSGFVAGTLDITCAILFLANGDAAGVFRFIARGAWGDAAYQGGSEMVLLGAFLHYMIAFCFAVGYFLVFPFFPLLRKRKLISGLLYGVFIWAFMQYLVLPLTFNPPEPFSIAGSWKSIVILMVAVGLPVSLITHAHYASSR